MSSARVCILFVRCDRSSADELLRKLMLEEALIQLKPLLRRSFDELSARQKSEGNSELPFVLVSPGMPSPPSSLLLPQVSFCPIISPSKVLPFSITGPHEPGLCVQGPLLATLHPVPPHDFP